MTGLTAEPPALRTCADLLAQGRRAIPLLVRCGATFTLTRRGGVMSLLGDMRVR
jgi:hypothetical protein